MKTPVTRVDFSTKDDFRKLVLELLNPLKPYYGPEGASLIQGRRLAHYDFGAARMEAFARPLWALVPFWAGGGRDLSEGRTFEEIYKKGLVSGCNPSNPEYWGDCGDYDQRYVEMAAIAYGIIFAPEVIFDPLSREEKETVIKYLDNINTHPVPDCNWILFNVLVNLAFEKAGFKADTKKLNQYLERLETYYVGQGWYRDGHQPQKDYYISFAIHFYSLIYAALMKDKDPERSKIYKERAGLFASDFAYWFDEDGDSLPFGRSLTYRFAQLSFWGACLFAGVDTFSKAEYKGFIVRGLKGWFKRPVFDDNNILTIGYYYDNPLMSEGYNAYGSPYWAMKAFIFLMLEDEDEFFKVSSAPLPKLKKNKAMKEGDFFFTHFRNHTTAYPAGIFSYYSHGNAVSKYAKFAYDSKFGINVARSQYQLDECAPDSTLAFLVDGYVYVKRNPIECKILDTGVYSKWSPLKGITVESFIVPGEKGHKRIHKITSEIDCLAYDTGFAVRADDFEKVGFYQEIKEKEAILGNNYSRVSVSGEGKGYIIWANPNTNLYYPHTAIPSIEYEIKAGNCEIETLITAEIFSEKEN